MDPLDDLDVAADVATASWLLTTSDAERGGAEASRGRSLSRRLPEHWPPLNTTAQIHWQPKVRRGQPTAFAWTESLSHWRARGRDITVTSARTDHAGGCATATSSWACARTTRSADLHRRDSGSEHTAVRSTAIGSADPLGASALPAVAAWRWKPALIAFNRARRRHWGSGSRRGRPFPRLQMVLAAQKADFILGPEAVRDEPRPEATRRRRRDRD